MRDGQWVFHRLGAAFVAEMLSGSSPRFFGCILVPTEHFERPPAVFAGELVHKMAHQELFVLNACDRLVQPAGDDVWRFSIFAGVRRPTMGRLHAAHAIFRQGAWHLAC
jgi:HEXXH motif-containing protein